jgi:hypothetical protein
VNIGSGHCVFAAAVLSPLISSRAWVTEILLAYLPSFDEQRTNAFTPYLYQRYRKMKHGSKDQSNSKIILEGWCALKKKHYSHSIEATRSVALKERLQNNRV